MTHDCNRFLDLKSPFFQTKYDYGDNLNAFFFLNYVSNSFKKICI